MRASKVVYWWIRMKVCVAFRLVVESEQPHEHLKVGTQANLPTDVDDVVKEAKRRWYRCEVDCGGRQPTCDESLLNKVERSLVGGYHAETAQGAKEGANKEKSR